MLHLSLFECRILRLVLDGLTLEEIAQVAGVEQAELERRWRAILKRLGSDAPVIADACREAGFGRNGSKPLM
jgi:DNA-binding NarL/FixJ family response regulator